VSNGVSAMKRIAFVLGCLFAASAHSDGKPSGGLLLNAIGDHFTRYYCAAKFPEMSSDIRNAFAASRLRFVPVPCKGLECSSTDLTEDMKRLWSDSKQLSNDEAREMCASYQEVLKNTEERYSEELDALYGTIVER
jgi:hypothetical protein